MQLCEQDITLNDSTPDKNTAIAMVAAQLAESGLTTSDYLNGMLAREEQISTFLGNGIAIPHGTPETRDAVLQTGVRIMVFRHGVDWGEGNIARIVVGIAARSNEHLDILRQLTRALSDESIPDAIEKTNTTADVLALLTGHTAPLSAESGITESTKQATFTLHNPHGLHARPSAVLVNIIKQFDSTITVTNLDTQSTVIDAKNLMKIVSLGAQNGHRLKFSADGKDAVAALATIGKAIQEGLGENIILSSQQSAISPDLTSAPKRNWFSRLFS